MSHFLMNGISAYRGRFAPTPSGPLHLGSLLTALASYLDARHHAGRWLLRIDDLDRERCSPQATASILRQLESHGLLWDERPRHQSQHGDEYAAALQQLQRQELLFACRCTRAMLSQQSLAGPDGPVYAGSCRDARWPFEDAALRFRVDEGWETFDDRLQGPVRRSRATEIGDFVVWRRDGSAGYHLACAVDEGIQAISDVVRGADLVSSTLCQQILMRHLNLPSPRYTHLPLLLDHQGRKLSKQNHAPALDNAQASENLLSCLRLLHHAPPTELWGAAPDTLLQWAIPRWDPSRLPGGAGVMLLA